MPHFGIYVFLKIIFLPFFSMKLIKQLSLLAMIALTFGACKKKDAAADAADAMCTCATPMAALLKEMKSANDKPEEMMKIVNKFKEGGKVFSDCMKAVEEKYKDKNADPAFQEAFKKAMEAKCKDATDAMNEASSNQAVMPAPAPSDAKPAAPADAKPATAPPAKKPAH